MTTFENAFWAEHPAARLAGIDEAGRGPLAGPVIAGAVEIPQDALPALAAAELDGLTDSKKLTELQREHFFAILTAHPQIKTATGLCTPAEIDRHNILRATHLAMSRAASALPGGAPAHALVDGLPVRGLPCPSTSIVKGDAKSLLIAAASVIAKVTRDRIMTACETEYPGYGFAKHKGYPTPEHLAALRRLGALPIHRRSFGPVAEIISPGLF
jgi:Ribonuclease HII